MEILKCTSVGDVRGFFGGSFPEHHPEEYIVSRISSGHVFIAKDGGIIQGVLFYSIWWGNCPFIELIKVNEKYQKNGVGTSLLAAAEVDLKAKGFFQVLSSTEVINSMGKSFHAKRSFEPLECLELPHGREQFYRKTI